jgi:hypothetical protein
LSGATRSASTNLPLRTKTFHVRGFKPIINQARFELGGFMKRKQPKVGTTVFLSPAQRKALGQLEQQLDRSMGSLIREAIALLLERHNIKVKAR